MNKSSENTTRILEHLYHEKDPTMRMVGSICMVLMLDTPDWKTAAEILRAQNLITEQNGIFSLTPAGIAHIKEDMPQTSPAPEAVEQTAASSVKEEISQHPFLDFLVAFNHDLRSPLNAIIGFSRVILKGIDGPINDMQTEDLTSIYESGQRLLRMINEIVEMAKLEIGSIAPLYREIDLGPLLDDVLEEIQPTDKPVTLHNELPSGKLVFWTDSEHLQYIITSLAAFCLRNLEMGSIFLRAAAANDQVYITVEDTGSGWSPDEVRHLLQPYRAPDKVHHIGGAGLSLAIAGRVAAALGGTLTVESQLGKGTTFTLALPTEPPEGAERAM